MRECAAALLLAWLLPGEAFAAVTVPKTANPYIPAVVNLYESMEYEVAIDTLRKAEAWSGGNRKQEIVWLNMMEGVLYAELGDKGRAVAAFKRGLSLEPNAVPPVVTSLIGKHYRQAREALGLPPRAPDSAPPEEAEASPAPVPQGLPSMQSVQPMAPSDGALVHRPGGRPEGPRRWAWMPAAAGVVAVGAGAFAAVQANGRFHELTSTQNLDVGRAVALYNEGNTWKLATQVSLGIGAAGLLTGAALWFLGDEGKPAASAAFGPSRLTVGLTWRVP